MLDATVIIVIITDQIENENLVFFLSEIARIWNCHFGVIPWKNDNAFFLKLARTKSLYKVSKKREEKENFQATWALPLNI